MVGLAFLALLPAGAAAAADVAACSARKGLYEEWLALSKRGGPGSFLGKGALPRDASGAATETDKRRAIGREYETFFQCLSGTAEQQDKQPLAAACAKATSDRLAAIVCQTALYLKNGRVQSKEFIDSVPAGKKGAELIWDLEAIAAEGPDEPRVPALFLPGGPAYKLVDELFVLVLDDKENAAAKYFNLWPGASDAGTRHMDEQVKLLVRESPALVVKQWGVLWHYQPKLRNLASNMAEALSRPELQSMRQGLAAFCAKDNPDCPEIQKIFGRPE